MIKRFVQKALGVDQMLKDYQSITPHEDLQHSLKNMLDYYNVSVDVIADHLERISSSGPTVVVANHPFGCIEGLILPYLLLSVRKDVKLLVNPVLKTFDRLDPLFLYVEPYATPQAQSFNISATKKAYQWLKDGGMLVLFPAGTVSHITWNRWTVRDPMWQNSFVRMIRKTNASVTPMFVHGRNSALFQLLGLIHSRLRTAWLAKEFLKKRNQKIRISIGKEILHKKIPFELEDQEIASYMRFRTYMLANGPTKKSLTSTVRNFVFPIKKSKPIAPHGGTKALVQELASLPDKNLLEETKQFSVYFAQASQIPFMLEEIGRLREKTFRCVGEGTGETKDLDNFDAYYMHLFAWNKQHQEIVGAYRVGLSDVILKEKGIFGLYTRSLFKFDESFMENLNPCLELGRSFIRPKYQKNYASLLMLWRGIAKFVAKHPRYSKLFGTVSISNNYSNVSQHLIMNFVKRHTFDETLSKLVHPILPPKKKINFEDIDEPLLDAFIKEIDDVSDMISDYEVSDQGVPILLKHYLKLGGKIVGFNIDPEFQNCIDGLIFVDLLKTQPRTLQFYMNKEGFQQFQTYHGQSK